MSKVTALGALRRYGQVGVQSSVESASPHRLIGMLLDGALARVVTARGHLSRGEIAAKGENIGLAISILDGLRASLDEGAGGEIARNLERLYEYMARRLLEANLRNDAGALDETARLLREIKAGWDGISAAARTETRDDPADRDEAAGLADDTPPVDVAPEGTTA